MQEFGRHEHELMKCGTEGSCRAGCRRSCGGELDLCLHDARRLRVAGDGAPADSQEADALPHIVQKCVMVKRTNSRSYDLLAVGIGDPDVERG